MTMDIPKPIIPREHGAWVVAFVPLLVGASVAGPFTPNAALLATSILGAFMSYAPAQFLLRHALIDSQRSEKVRQAVFWMVASIALAGVSVIPLLVQGFFLLLLGGVIALALVAMASTLTRRWGKTILTDLIAVYGLALSAPAAYYVTAGSLNRTSWLLYFLNILFFGCTVVYVHMKIRASSSRKPIGSPADRLSLGKLNILYQVAVLLIVGLLAAVNWTRYVSVLAFLPMVGHAVIGTYRVSGRVRFKTLGFILLAQSILFGVLVVFVV